MTKLKNTIYISVTSIILAVLISIAIVPAWALISNPPRQVSTTGFLTSPVGDADVVDTITASNYLPLVGGTLTGQLNGTNASLSANLELTAAGSKLAINAGALTDTMLEVGGTASISGALTLKGAVTGATSYNGLVITADTGDITTGTWNGTAIDEGKIDWVVTGQAIDFGGATSLEIPNAAAPTVDATGEIAIHTGSGSLDYYYGTQVAVIIDRKCFTYAFEAPTTTENWGNKKFTDPFTITDVTVIASGSNAVGWNMLHGAFGAITTTLFSATKSASSSSAPTYTTFNDATLGDGEFLQLQIASPSATIENLDITLCGRDGH